MSYVIPEYSPSLESTLPPDRRLNEDLVEDSLETLEVPSLDDLGEDDSGITDCQFIGSYSWTKRTHPTIIVPGKQPKLFVSNRLP